MRKEGKDKIVHAHNSIIRDPQDDDVRAIDYGAFVYCIIADSYLVFINMSLFCPVFSVLRLFLI